jgi:hypothetical protein
MKPVIMLKRWIFILVLIFGFSLLSAQTFLLDKVADSVRMATLKEAETSFQNGLYQQCVDTLQALIGKGKCTKIQLQQALELQAKANVELDEREQADAGILRMLKNNPHYELNERANPEGFNRMVKKYRVHPLLSVAIRNTANWNRFTSMKTYTVLDGMDYNSPYRGPESFGFFYYAWLEYEFVPTLSVNFEWIFFHTLYNRTLVKAPDITLTFNENFNFIEFPVSIRKYFQFPISKSIYPYVTLGGCFLIITGAEGWAGLTVGDSSQYLNKVDMMPMRNRLTFEFTAGTGLCYQIKNLRLFIDMRYFTGLNSLSNAAKRNANSSLRDDFFYVDNAFRMNQFELGASASYTLFNSVKKRRR